MAVDEVLVVLNNGGLFHNTGELDEDTFKNLEEAFCYWNEFRPENTIVTGGHSFEGRLMSSAMKEYLMTLGIPQNQILEERRPSRDTFENIEGVLPILREVKPHKIVLITTGIHMTRAVKSFSLYFEEENLKIEIDPLPSTPQDIRLSAWEKGARLVYALDPGGMGKSPLYQLARWFLFRQCNVPR